MTPIVVLDNGGGLLKVGLAGNEAPTRYWFGVLILAL
jgi:actin-related protein